MSAASAPCDGECASVVLTAKESPNERAFEETLAPGTVVELDHFRRQLHDGLGQLLTSASFLVTSLRAKLAAGGWIETNEVDEIVTLLNQAVAESRTLVTECDRRRSAARSNTGATPLLG